MKFQVGDVVYLPIIIKDVDVVNNVYSTEPLGQKKSKEFTCHSKEARDLIMLRSRQETSRRIDLLGVKAEIVVPELLPVELPK